LPVVIKEKEEKGKTTMLPAKCLGTCVKDCARNDEKKWLDYEPIRLNKID